MERKISVNRLLKAIHKNCIECSAGSVAEARKCIYVACPLYPYRMGLSKDSDEEAPK
jgi:hypothetical protein